MSAEQQQRLAQRLEATAPQLSEGELEALLDSLDAALRRVREFVRKRADSGDRLQK